VTGWEWISTFGILLLTETFRKNLENSRIYSLGGTRKKMQNLSGIKGSRDHASPLPNPPLLKSALDATIDRSQFASV